MTSHSFFNSRHLWLGGIFLATLATGISIYSVVSSGKPNATNSTSLIANTTLPVTVLDRHVIEDKVRLYPKNSHRVVAFNNLYQVRLYAHS